MRTSVFVLALAVCALMPAVCFAQDAFVGTWKLNEAKSHLSPGAPKYSKVVFMTTSDGVKVTIDGSDRDGKPIHDEWVGRIDGKDYAVVGNPNEDFRSLTKIDEHTLGFNGKRGGTITTSGRVDMSADGKSRTVTTGGTNAQGKKFKSIAVYDKQ